MLNKRLFAVVLVLATALAGCATNDVALKVLAGAIDSLKLAGATAKLVAGPMDATCRAGLPKTVTVCDTWYVFVKGLAPADPVCKGPTAGLILEVYQKCGFKVTYPFLYRLYEEKKDVGLAAASVLTTIIKQVTGFTESVTGGGQ